VIFVSSDEKADWRYKSEGQTLYPRYELADEYRRNSEGQSFHIIQFSNFLDLYGASEEVVEEIRQKEQQSYLQKLYAPQQEVSTDKFPRMINVAEEAVYRWLAQNHPTKKVVRQPRIDLPIRPDFAVINDDGSIVAVETKFIRSNRDISLFSKEIRYLAAKAGYYGVRKGILNGYILVIIGLNSSTILEVADILSNSITEISGISYYFFTLRTRW
jgi:hypothetical protein